MMKYILVVLSAAMVLSLTAFAVTSATPQGVQFKPEDSSPEAIRDAKILNQLGLSAKQKKQWEELQVYLKAETKKMMAMPSGHFEKGAEINRTLHVRLQKIMTKAQYGKYCDLWGCPRGGFAAQGEGNAFSPARREGGAGQSSGGTATAGGKAGG